MNCSLSVCVLQLTGNEFRMYGNRFRRYNLLTIHYIHTYINRFLTTARFFFLILFIHVPVILQKVSTLMPVQFSNISERSKSMDVVPLPALWRGQGLFLWFDALSLFLCWKGWKDVFILASASAFPKYKAILFCSIQICISFSDVSLHQGGSKNFQYQL